MGKYYINKKNVVLSLYNMLVSYINNQFFAMLAKLKEHDYVSAKIADGRATIDEYTDVIAQKTAWAKEINDANVGIVNLEGVTLKDDDTCSKIII